MAPGGVLRNSRSGVSGKSDDHKCMKFNIYDPSPREIMYLSGDVNLECRYTLVNAVVV